MQGTDTLRRIRGTTLCLMARRWALPAQMLVPSPTFARCAPGVLLTQSLTMLDTSMWPMHGSCMRRSILVQVPPKMLLLARLGHVAIVGPARPLLALTGPGMPWPREVGHSGTPQQSIHIYGQGLGGLEPRCQETRDLGCQVQRQCEPECRCWCLRYSLRTECPLSHEARHSDDP